MHSDVILVGPPLDRAAFFFALHFFSRARAFPHPWGAMGPFHKVGAPCGCESGVKRLYPGINA